MIYNMIKQILRVLYNPPLVFRKLIANPDIQGPLLIIIINGILTVVKMNNDNMFINYKLLDILFFFFISVVVSWSTLYIKSKIFFSALKKHNCNLNFKSLFSAFGYANFPYLFTALLVSLVQLLFGQEIAEAFFLNFIKCGFLINMIPFGGETLNKFITVIPIVPSAWVLILCAAVLRIQFRLSKSKSFVYSLVYWIIEMGVMVLWG